MGRLKRSPNTSARILVAVKSLAEIQGAVKLLFSKIIGRDDHILFLHVAERSEPSLERDFLDKAIAEAAFSIKNLISKVTISSLVVESPEICDGIVQEAKKIKATMVILGHSGRRFISRSMHKLGKHCVRNLPSYCSILIVRKGKVLQVKSGSANVKGQTLKALLNKVEHEQKEKSSEVLAWSEVESQASSSCSMDTVLSFSSESSLGCSPSLSGSNVSSPSSVLDNQQETALSKSSALSVLQLAAPRLDFEPVKHFTYEELVVATKNFGRDNLVGTGGCCNVYRGILQDGCIVAVKRLLDSSSGEREFSREIKVISYIRHTNLVSLIGFCTEETHRLLVYQFLRNGSLQHHLHGGGKLSWKKRQRIALGAARGLQHLHDLAPHHVIHQDVKSSNILLTDDFQAQISDFGFARWSNELTLASSGLVGTFGYMAPEYLVHGIANEKTDVYSFGVVLLELITGRPPIDSSLPTKQQSLAHWATLLEKTGRTYEMVDRKLEFVDAHEMRRMMYAALLCVRSVPEERPTMQKVVRILDAELACTEALLCRYEPSP